MPLTAFQMAPPETLMLPRFVSFPADPECPIRPLNHATARVDNCRVDVCHRRRWPIVPMLVIVPPVNVPGVTQGKICPVATLVMPGSRREDTIGRKQ